MANKLLSGPAGASKSAEARRLIEESPDLTVAADFQAIHAALTLVERDPETGLYPARNDGLLPITQYVRRAVVTGAVARGINVVLTNSDGDPEHRRFLLGLLGQDAVEEILDPGEEVVRRRLSNGKTGVLSTDCNKAIRRWYGRYRKR